MNETTNPARQRPAGGAPRLVGTVVCALVLALSNLVTGYLAFLAYAVGPAGPWDTEASPTPSTRRAWAWPWPW
ncbi:hypothetical protein ACFVFI_09660 [Streptomyces sp. NPDC057705]|uniref:hypothetical protein n=1 Tax=Streptomyces sp. NPDC057705 TaxID=3346222 RepID=UPI0036CD4898